MNSSLRCLVSTAASHSASQVVYIPQSCYHKAKEPVHLHCPEPAACDHPKPLRRLLYIITHRLASGVPSCSKLFSLFQQTMLRFEVSILWDTALYTPCMNQRFDENYYLHHQGRKCVEKRKGVLGGRYEEFCLYEADNRNNHCREDLQSFTLFCMFTITSMSESNACIADFITVLAK